MLYAWAVRLISAVIKPGNASATANRLNVIIVIMTKLPFVGPGNPRRRAGSRPRIERRVMAPPIAPNTRMRTPP